MVGRVAEWRRVDILVANESGVGATRHLTARLRVALSAEATSAVGLVHLCGGGPKSRERGYRHHPR